MPRKKSSVENDFEPVFWKPWFQVFLFCGSCRGKVLLLGWLIDSVVMFQSMSSRSLTDSRSSVTRSCGMGRLGWYRGAGEVGGVTIIVISEMLVPNSVFCLR